jgi:RNA polymerase sigma-70 factor (ECF subfamily)
MNQVDTTDEWLMGQVARGHREHLETLIRRYASSLLTYLHRMTGDRHSAEELFQDAFLAVWEKRRTYRFPRRFRSWLFAIATNRCRQAFRRTASAKLLPLPESGVAAPAGNASNPVQSAVSVETAQMVARAVACLPPAQRTVLVLRNWNGLTYGEIAQVVGRSEGTVRSHMHHALAQLRRHLEPRLRANDL